MYKSTISQTSKGYHVEPFSPLVPFTLLSILVAIKEFIFNVTYVKHINIKIPVDKSIEP